MTAMVVAIIGVFTGLLLVNHARQKETLAREAESQAKQLAEAREAESQDAEGKAKLSHALPVLTAAEAQPIELLTMQPAGNYAYRIGFSDGHQTGIYSFELLRQIGDQFSRPNSLGQEPPPDTA